MKGFKATDSEGKCKGFKFKVGKTYEIEGKLQICNNGFHFCQNLFDVYNYYDKSENTRVFEVEALGDVQTEDDKSSTSKIHIIRELTTLELLKAWINRTNSGNRNSGNWNSGDGNSGNRNSGNWNSGNWNSGDGNSGNRNSGHRNSGNWNSGHRNSGNWNSGDWNSGDWNSGDGNSGNRNSGHWNSGDGNSGNRNSGHWNSGDGNSGYFNTMVPIYFFNKPSKLKYTHEFEKRIRALNVKPKLTWIYSNSMTEEEKAANPSHKITGGFLRDSGKMDWTLLTKEDKDFIKSLPNFNDDIFKQISGVHLTSVKPRKRKC